MRPLLQLGGCEPSPGFLLTDQSNRLMQLQLQFLATVANATESTGSSALHSVPREVRRPDHADVCQVRYDAADGRSLLFRVWAPGGRLHAGQ